MSIYHSPLLVKLLMDERLREARQSNALHCCAGFENDRPRSSIVNLFSRRPSPAACAC
jgi:hypothetical protein